jgi:Leucine rich repeat
LALNDNRISIIPDNLFLRMENLTQLLLHNNAVQYVWPRTFAGLRSLTRLQLAGNRLGQLPDGMLRHSPHLRHLDLDGNQLKTFGRCALPLPPRRTALSRGSSSGGSGSRTSSSSTSGPATAAPAEVGGSRMKFLSLIGNPMICDCQLTWLVEFQQQTSMNSDNEVWPTGPLWPTIRGTCHYGRSGAESRLHHPSSPLSSGVIAGGSSKSSQVAAGLPDDWTSSMSMELSQPADRRVSSIIGRCSQLAPSCAKQQLQKTSDCHYE